MHVGRADEHRHQRVLDPSRSCRWQHRRSDEQRQAPDLADQAGQEPLVGLFRHPCPEEEVDDEQYVRRNCQHVDLEATEGFLQDERQV